MDIITQNPQSFYNKGYENSIIKKRWVKLQIKKIRLYFLYYSNPFFHLIILINVYGEIFANFINT